MKKEIWKPIKGYEELYEVSSYGNVRSLDRVVTYSDGVKRLRKGRIMKLTKDRYGYLTCYLYKNSKSKFFTVHRLVAEAFIPNPNNLPFINHKDENKSNNYIENLEWCTQSYNINYGTCLRRIAEKLSMPVLQLDKNTNEVISEYPSTREAARQLKISSSSISMCCNGKQKTAYGFKWVYKE